jgi:hypothetical protein
MNGMVRYSGLILLALVASGAHAAPAEAAAASVPGSDMGSGFRLEGRPAVDDVFGDASDYRRTVDRFLELTASMQAMRDDFARAVQGTLAGLAKQEPHKGKKVCPVDAVATPYTRAHHLGVEYLRVGRELTRHYDTVKEFDRLGESIGLTPDYRWKVKRVLQQYNTMVVDYREMKVAFHDQLNDELKYAGCDLQALLMKGDPKGGQVAEVGWPQPGQPGAPGVPVAKSDKDHDAPPASLPSEKVPPPAPIPIPKRVTAPADPRDGQPRSGILFYVDNSKCQRGTSVYLDGKKLGEVPAAQRVGFQTHPGPHDLCLVDDTKKPCGQPGTVRRSYIHEGWTISLRCE